MDDDWFDDALSEGYRPEDEDDEECPICGDDAGYSCPCVRD
ncbi:MAG: hypothetical protein AAFR98_11925 [Pseudomonadota bacterium]